MDELIAIVAIVIGFPILGGSLVAIAAILRSWALKSRELKVREKELQMEERLRTDELNARILKLDDAGISPAELACMAEEVRQLRHELSQLKQELRNRAGTL